VLYCRVSNSFLCRVSHLPDKALSLRVESSILCGVVF
jgi:hypothetical protein